ncbi:MULTISPECIES: TonB-dependent hemoglobin/transferrin/lactoferrin family receptor [Alphaproteobacteria]|uniref:TonB-dependent receptor n=2 Tax=Alphaproteobacteria TaxID=28211 RepID=A0A512HEY9_9HYPH|nr:MULTISPECIES: TonB-dependent hemoglobin/transferrin/lactoferrin family receptor [Alphaproteobacteria]GEO83997.1 TonB-dependent receptor [Ciceribacter naphthalenivorans]GLR21125.1 TonB-dependent receptor [Ciceribacter naphthalenivorans]GLT03981.1 TonB-dependent receptor [Sphingomonas psychrolutea]
MVVRHFRPLLLTCTALVAVAPGFSALAQQADASGSAAGDTQLETIVVKGKRVAQGSVADTPLATQTTQDDIAKKEIDSLEDLGNTTEPGVTFVEATQSVNIRGLEDDRVLTTIDGIPIPYLSDLVRSSFGGANSYDFSSLSSIDILRGADSSRAGSGALGGAVLLRTLEPEDLIGEGKDFGGVAKTTYDSSDQSFGGSLAVAKKVDNTSVLLQGSYKKGHEQETGGDVGGYGSTRTEANPEDYDKTNVLFKIRQDLEGGHQIGITAERYDFDSTTNLKGTQGSTYAKDNYDEISDNTRNRVSLDYRYEAIAEDSLIDAAFATLYWQKTERKEGTDGYRNTAPIGDYSRISTNEEEAFGFAGYIYSDFATGMLQHRLTIGTDLSFATTTQFARGEDSCDVTYVPTCAYFHNNQADMPETDSKRIGLYAEDRIEIGSSGFSLTPGLRFDWYDYDPQETAGYENNSGYSGLPDGQSDWALSPKLRAGWQARPDVELFTQFATGFKAPNVSQLYSNFDNGPLYRQVGNPDLEAESSYGFEVGANLGDEDFGGRVTAFTTRYKDFIDTATVPLAGYMLGSFEFFNRGNVRISGVEVRAQKKFANGFSAHGSVAYAYGEDLDSNEVLGSVPPLKAIIGLGYETENWGTDVSLIAAAAVDEDSTASSKPAGYGIVNLTGWWEPEQVQGLRVQAGVYNVFDKTYFDALEVKDVANASELYSQAGRYFKFSVTQKF